MQLGLYQYKDKGRYTESDKILLPVDASSPKGFPRDLRRRGAIAWKVWQHGYH